MNWNTPSNHFPPLVIYDPGISNTDRTIPSPLGKLLIVPVDSKAVTDSGKEWNSPAPPRICSITFPVYAEFSKNESCTSAASCCPEVPAIVLALSANGTIKEPTVMRPCPVIRPAEYGLSRDPKMLEYTKSHVPFGSPFQLPMKSPTFSLVRMG